MIRVFQIKCAQENELEGAILKKLRIRKEDLLDWHLHRKSVDARHQKVLFSYVVDCKVKNEKKYLKLKDVQPTPDETYHPVQSGHHKLKSRPVVVGFGPAGMFAALILAQAGYKPLILERGSKVDIRKEKVDAFWNSAKLDVECNVQFGEGGAGAFSDGKLTTRSKDSLCRKVLEELVHFGAKEEILIDQHPHIGTDAFLGIIKNLRKEIETLGGEFLFDTKLEEIEVKNNELQKIKIDDQWIDCQSLILACGHSASDTIKMLHKKGVMMENKPFAVGVRIEHKQEYINKAMLHEYCHDSRLIPARYQLTYTASNKKGVYTFCMCPGGYVIPSSSQKEQLVVNGMSYASRSGENANSALLIQINESDYGNKLFAGLQYQEELEKKAYQMAGNYKACCQLAKDYLKGVVSQKFEQVEPTYSLGTTFCDLNELFSPSVNLALHEALEAFEKKVCGFVSEGAILSAVESRSSSSIRIHRDCQGLSNIHGIYPSGEGSGYAGGIMTSAIDGIRSAQHLIGYYSKEDLYEAV